MTDVSLPFSQLINRRRHPHDPQASFDIARRHGTAEILFTPDNTSVTPDSLMRVILAAATCNIAVAVTSQNPDPAHVALMDAIIRETAARISPLPVVSAPAPTIIVSLYRPDEIMLPQDKPVDEFERLFILAMSEAAER
jgi:hypothetical protein